jgi:hypothetical protein
MTRVSPARWPRLLTEAAAAEYFSITVNSLRSLNLSVIRIAHRPLYDRHVLDAWVGCRIADAAADGVDLTDDQPFELVQQHTEEVYDWRADQPGLTNASATDGTVLVMQSLGRSRKASSKP